MDLEVDLEVDLGMDLKVDLEMDLKVDLEVDLEMDLEVGLEVDLEVDRVRFIRDCNRVRFQLELIDSGQLQIGRCRGRQSRLGSGL